MKSKLIEIFIIPGILESIYSFMIYRIEHFPAIAVVLNTKPILQFREISKTCKILVNRLLLFLFPIVENIKNVLFWTQIFPHLQNLQINTTTTTTLPIFLPNLKRLCVDSQQYLRIESIQNWYCPLLEDLQVCCSIRIENTPAIINQQFPKLQNLMLGSIETKEDVRFTNFALLKNLTVGCDSVALMKVVDCPSLISFVCESGSISILAFENVPNLTLLKCGDGFTQIIFNDPILNLVSVDVDCQCSFDPHGMVNWEKIETLRFWCSGEWIGFWNKAIHLQTLEILFDDLILPTNVWTSLTNLTTLEIYWPKDSIIADLRCLSRNLQSLSLEWHCEDLNLKNISEFTKLSSLSLTTFIGLCSNFEEIFLLPKLQCLTVSIQRLTHIQTHMLSQFDQNHKVAN